ncbi:N-acetylmuramoyl-L-alanine amidase [Nocardia sp. NPDC023852]|uniref:N-acetylmuramoyl-L-alanine amidase n=1 Tax=Nocardia sp. NPDC023852 TaxID=3154697 RepID=UPI0033D5E8A7
MRYRKPKRSYVLPVVTTLAVAAPLGALTLGDSTEYRTATDENLAAVPAQLAEVVLNNTPDIVLPLRELTGLDLPDLHLSDLRMLPIPSSIPVPQGLPLPPGVQLPEEIPLPHLNFGQASGRNIPSRPMPNSQNSIPEQAREGVRFIADPSQLEPGTTPDTPALSPGAVPPELMTQLGAQVKELSRDIPFSMVALTAKELGNTKATIRARQPDGTWGPWYDTEPVDTHRTDRSGKGAVGGTEPIYVGNTNAVQVLVTRKPTERQTPTPLTQPARRSDDSAQQSADALTAVLIDPGRGAIDSSLDNVSAALPGSGPNVITRAQWGADESIRCDEPTYDDDLGGVTVHHTAGRNDYSKSESAGIVRAIYTYHAKTLGWCDIGYNALIDRYGQIFEGRFGGLDRPVQGAHAGGFNENTSGVALMGNYESEQPTNESLTAIGQFIGWRTKVAGLDPKGYTTMYSEGTQFTPYAQGEAVRLPVVFAHRDVGNTSCPGDAAYALMDRIRDLAAGTPGTSGPNNQIPPHSHTDLAALTALTTKLLNMVQENIIARHWSATGGPDGPLGVAQSDVLPAAQGQQYAKFTNGYVYTAPNGRVVEVLGAILDRFLQLGADAGILGLPTTNAYPVPDGQRADFQYGSLILNQPTGIVTTVWKTYNDTYQQEMSRSRNGAVAGPAPAGIPAADVARARTAAGGDPASTVDAAPDGNATTGGGQSFAGPASAHAGTPAPNRAEAPAGSVPDNQASDSAQSPAGPPQAHAGTPAQNRAEAPVGSTRDVQTPAGPAPAAIASVGTPAPAGEHAPSSSPEG